MHVDPGAGWFPHFLGFADETAGGSNRNLPLPPGTGDEPWLGGRGRACRLGAAAPPGSSSRSAWTRPPTIPRARCRSARAAFARRAHCSARSACRRSSSRRAATTSERLGPLVRETLLGLEEGRRVIEISPEYLRQRRRAARVVPVAPARVPRGRARPRSARPPPSSPREMRNLGLDERDRGAGARRRAGGSRRPSSSSRTGRGSSAPPSAASPRPGARESPASSSPVGRGGRKQLDRVDVRGKIALVEWQVARLWPYHVGPRARPARGGRDGRLLPAGRPVLPGARRARHLRRHLARGGPALRDCHEGGRREARSPRRRAGARRPAGAADPRRRGCERRRRAARPAARRSGDRGRPPRRLVRGRLRRRDRRRGHARAGARHSPRRGSGRERTIAFVSHTAEEYGIAESAYDWCYGAWYQVVAEHREWATGSPFYLNVEGSGPARSVHARRAAGAHGLGAAHLPAGRARRPAAARLQARRRRTPGPRSGRSWPPGSRGSTSRPSRPSSTAPSTTRSTTRPTSVDFDYLAQLTEVCARLLLDAPPELDFAARARGAARGAAREAPARARRAREAKGRKRFTAVGRGLHGLDAIDAPRYPHEQTAADVALLEQALADLGNAREAAGARRAQLALLRSLARGVQARASPSRPQRPSRLLGRRRATPTPAPTSGASSPRSAASRAPGRPGPGSRRACAATSRARAASSRAGSTAWRKPPRGRVFPLRRPRPADLPVETRA